MRNSSEAVVVADIGLIEMLYTGHIDIGLIEMLYTGHIDIGLIELLYTGHIIAYQ